MSRKDIIEIKRLNTKRLLAYYKAERKRFYNSGYICGCGCGEYVWNIYSEEKYMETKHNEHKKYLELIKSELNNREHVF